MSDVVIRVENLSKKYVLDHQQDKSNHKTLRDAIAGGAQSLLSGLTPKNQKESSKALHSKEEFWALKDVSFEIKQGDRVGIIGRNGAGKSTLLKILSRIVDPTRGKIDINGRIASLLEVGTGFHPELTGRENIYLNGAILGMSRVEIERKFDEIVAFSEVEKFLDTPVKRYSSGMYVRLAFAVAAHLEPEILILDEVLAVGDAQFQKKCLGKMEEVAREGRTILFVSHTMATVTGLCQKAIWLVKGQVHEFGEAEQIAGKYLTYGMERSGEIVFSTPKQNPEFLFKRLTLLNSHGTVVSNFDVRAPIKARLEYQLATDIEGLELSFKISNSLGVPIFTVNRSASIVSKMMAGTYVGEIEIPPLFLPPGSYMIDIAAHIPMVKILSHHESIIGFEIEETGSNMALYHGASFGAVLVDFPWQERKLTENRVRL